jgi:hypothetical protein
MGIRLPHEPSTPSDVDVPASTYVGRLDVRASVRRARLRGWKLPITDGPFAESKEMLGGASSIGTPASVGTDKRS